MSRRNRVLVTGGAGFLGSHLCERLLAQDCQVLCVDNYFTGSRDNIAGMLSNPRFEALRHDITFPLYVEVDQIYNLACPASPMHYHLDPVQTTKVNVHGSINMLGLAKRVRASILQASTSEVYGDAVEHPQTEDYWGNVNAIGTRACYAEGKRCAETLFFDYRRQHGVAIKVARLFNAYGPRMFVGDGRVMSTFVVQALRGEPLTVCGDGGQTRSFCYVDDTIDGLLKLMSAPNEITGPINVGNTQEITILELANLIIRLTGSKSGIVHTKLPQDSPSRRQPDITKAAAILGWAPATPLETGIEKTIGYFDHLLSAESSTPPLHPVLAEVRTGPP